MERTIKKCSFDIASILKATVNNSYMDDTEDGSSDDGQVQPKCSSPVSTYSVLPQTRTVDHCLSSCSSSFECEPVNWNRSAMKSSMPHGKMKSKRLRTIFTGEQLERLEAEFEKQQYMVGHERLRLARILDLSETQVKVIMIRLCLSIFIAI